MTALSQVSRAQKYKMGFQHKENRVWVVDLEYGQVRLDLAGHHTWSTVASLHLYERDSFKRSFQQKLVFEEFATLHSISPFQNLCSRLLYVTFVMLFHRITIK